MILVIGQEELEAEVEDSNIAAVMGGGLLPALVDAAIENSRSKSAEKLVSPLRARLVDIDFRKELASELKKQLNSSWLHMQKVEVTSALTSAERKHMFENSQGNAILLIDAKYKLSPDFMALKTSSLEELYLKDVKDPIYKNKIEILSDPVAVKSKEEAVAAWDENEGSKIRYAIRDGAKRLAEAIAGKLMQPSKTVAAKEAHSTVN